MPLDAPLRKTNAVVLNGWTLAQLSLGQLKQIGDYFAQQFLRVSSQAAAGLDDTAADRLMDSATRAVSAGRFVYGQKEFLVNALDPTNLPYLLRACLLPEHKTVTLAECEAMITPTNQAAVSTAVLEMMGYTLPNAGTAAQTPPAAAEPPNPPLTPSAT